jgi:hypothetical protein
MNQKQNVYKKYFVDNLSLSKSDVRLVDLFSPLIKYDATIFRDDHHYNERGHELLTEIMWPTIAGAFFP